MQLDFSVIAGRVIRQFFVVSIIVTVVLPSFQNLFPLPGRNWGCHPYKQNVEDFKMWHIRFCNDKLMTMCAAKHVIMRVHVFISITVRLLLTFQKNINQQPKRSRANSTQ